MRTETNSASIKVTIKEQNHVVLFKKKKVFELQCLWVKEMLLQAPEVLNLFVSRSCWRTKWSHSCRPQTERLMTENMCLPVVSRCSDEQMCESVAVNFKWNIKTFGNTHPILWGEKKYIKLNYIKTLISQHLTTLERCWCVMCVSGDLTWKCWCVINRKNRFRSNIQIRKCDSKYRKFYSAHSIAVTIRYGVRCSF